MTIPEFFNNNDFLRIFYISFILFLLWFPISSISGGFTQGFIVSAVIVFLIVCAVWGIRNLDLIFSYFGGGF